MEAVLGVLTDYEGLARIYTSIEESKLSVNGRRKSVLQVTNPCIIFWLDISFVHVSMYMLGPDIEIASM